MGGKWTQSNEQQRYITLKRIRHLYTKREKKKTKDN